MPTDHTFETDFQSYLGYPPFAWQSRLYRNHFLTGSLPSAVDVPTGLGKTAVIALWLLARRAGSPLPRRLIYVVDRRAVVDQATEVADTLARVCGGTAVSTLRGQHADNERWRENPATEAIVVGTVDMIGSRLLFEGYGVSRRMRPYHAGLLGTDTLVVLDEAHLCPPFEALLDTIANDPVFRPTTPVRAALVPRLQLLPLSATHAPTAAAGFSLQPQDTDPAQQPLAHQRFTASKHLHLTTIEKKDSLHKALARTAIDCAKPGLRVIVYCNSRETATKVAKELQHAKHCETQLLTGARRVLERNQVGGWLSQHGFMGPPLQPGALAPILIATSAGEVGVDLDADHMVCDLVPFERMVQRLGRVNRRGGSGRIAHVEVLLVPPKPPSGGAGKKKKKKTAAELAQEKYAACLSATCQLLAKLRPISDAYDASPAALLTLRSQFPAEATPATTPAPLRPQLDLPVIEAWSLTSLRDHPGRPHPAPWLRGWETLEAPEAAVLWRRWLPWRLTDPLPNKREVEEFFQAAPPQPDEILRADVWQIIAVLRARARAMTDQDAPGVLLLNHALELDMALTISAIATTDPGDLERKLTGAVVAISSSLGGLNPSGLLDPKAAAPPLCLDRGWDEALLSAAGLRVLTPGQNPSDDWKVIASFNLADTDEAEPVQIAALRTAQAPDAGDPSLRRRRQSLQDHVVWVSEELDRIAVALSLPGDYRRALQLAARLHDEGKRRDFWQDAMCTPREGRPWAKSDRSGHPQALRIGQHTYQHAFGSLAAAEADSELNSLPADIRDLALHLIASHHGQARPLLAPVDPDLLPSDPQLARRAQDAAVRFARLQQQWGPWGLAWWEAIFRAADQTASRRLDRDEKSARHD